MDSTNADFARVYDEQLSSVYGFLAYRTQDPHLAEDLTQATFERALRAWTRFDPRRASVRTWLLVIARNLLIDHHRQRGGVVLEELDDENAPAASDPEANFGASPDLLAALRELTDRDREVIALRFGADLTGPEISALLGLSLANVQQVLSRSLRRLRATLEGQAPEAQEP
jgi:RNA polymerase sigma-70 factor (ECF subfamily)